MDQLQTRLDALEQRTHTLARQLRWWRGLACGGSRSNGTKSVKVVQAALYIGYQLDPCEDIREVFSAPETLDSATYSRLS